MNHAYTLFTALLLTPLTALHVKRNSAGVQRFGMLRGGSSLALETLCGMASNDWNSRITLRRKEHL